MGWELKQALDLFLVFLQIKEKRGKGNVTEVPEDDEVDLLDVIGSMMLCGMSF